ncbi:hypothetical protein GCM10010191_44520 [Actinomadura vinacea]|uniref:Uncharacterized protein n=1 Tax=Actinomadura vinacea TaxID=115336 RepID=A0ABN3JCE0_9ACTN
MRRIGAVGCNLREHGLPPEPGLVAHIRGNGFELPDVLKHLGSGFESGPS